MPTKKKPAKSAAKLPSNVRSILSGDANVYHVICEDTPTTAWTPKAIDDVAVQFAAALSANSGAVIATRAGVYVNQIR